MKHSRRSFLHVAPAGIAFVLFSFSVTVSTASAAIASSGPSKAASKWAGDYQSDPPKPGTPGGSMSVSLGTDGTATVTQDYGKGENTSFGRWTDSGSQITVTFDPAAGTPTQPPMTFSSGHDGLQAVTWDHAAWGKLTPPPMKKGAGNWHKGQHKF